jgi:hypothetical protein
VNAAVLLLFGAAFVALAFGGRRLVPGRAFVWLRAFFPSWRFFEDIGPVPTLRWRAGASADALGPWRDAHTPHARPWTALLYNPKGNLTFAEHALVEHLLIDLDDVPDAAPDDAAQLVSYRLVQRVVEAQARAAGGAGLYQFRVDLCATDAAPSESDVVLLSTVHPL